MNGYLLDTHALVWLLDDSPRLGPHARACLTDGSPIHYSPASLWELRTKELKGRFPIPATILELIRQAGLVELPIHSADALAIDLVSASHGDPFDRMIASQARTRGLTLVTADSKLLPLNSPATLDARK